MHCVDLFPSKLPTSEVEMLAQFTKTKTSSLRIRVVSTFQYYTRKTTPVQVKDPSVNFIKDVYGYNSKR